MFFRHALCLALVLIPALSAQEAKSPVAPVIPDRVLERADVAVGLARIEGVAAVSLEPGTPRRFSAVPNLPRLGRTDFQLVSTGGESLAALSTAGGVRAALPVFRDTRTGAVVLALDQVAVHLAAGVSADELQRWAADHGLALKEQVATQPEIAHFTVIDPSTQDAFAAAEELGRSGLVEWAEPTLWVEPQRLATPDDPTYPLQWHLNNTGQFGGVPSADINAPEAWNTTQGSDSLVFAIIDDGVDLGHPDLRIWTRPGEVPGDLMDNDGNGFVDDTFGWDFADGDNDPNPSHFVYPFNIAAHNDIHGTPVAGLTAARGSNELGVAGASLRGQVMAIRLVASDQLVSEAAHAAAIRYAVDNGADVINLSYSMPLPSQEVEEAFEHALAAGRGGRGSPIFAAAGDSGSGVRWPGFSPWTAAVGSSTNLDTAATYSSMGERLTFVAPSSGGTFGLFTTDVSIPDRGFDDYNPPFTPRGHYTQTFGGTSASTALTSGVAGLVLAANPNLRWHEVYQILSETADKAPPGNVNDYDIFGIGARFGWGRLNAAAAVARAQSATPIDDHFEPNNSIATPTPLGNQFFQHLIARDEDNFAFSATANRIISIDLWHLATDPAPTLELRTLNGFLITTGRPRAGGLQIHLQNGAVDQPLLVRVVPPPGVPSMGYTLSIRNLATDAYESNDAFGDAPLVVPPAVGQPLVIEAHIEPVGDIDIFAISGRAGDQVTVETRARRLTPPSPLDTVLSLYRSDGKSLLARNDDHTDSDSLISLTLPADDLYFIEVHDFHGDGGPDYAYTLEAQGFTPTFPTADQLAEFLLGLIPEPPQADVTRSGHVDVGDLVWLVNNDPRP